MPARPAVVTAAPTLTVVTGSGCRQLHRSAATIGDEGLPPPYESKAPRGARRRRSRRWTVTQPLLPITFDASEKRTHDYVRHGTTNLFAALNTATGEVFGECRPSKDAENFLAFLRKAVAPYAGREIHIVVDNL